MRNQSELTTPEASIRILADMRRICKNPSGEPGGSQPNAADPIGYACKSQPGRISNADQDKSSSNTLTLPSDTVYCNGAATEETANNYKNEITLSSFLDTLSEIALAVASRRQDQPVNKEP